MKTHRPNFPPRVTRPGRAFALVSTMLVLSAISILCVALFTLMRYEVATVGAHERQFRAELGIESGLNAAVQSLAAATADDLSVIHTKKTSDGTPVLLASRHDTSGMWKTQPLVSGTWRPADTGDLSKIETPPAGSAPVRLPGGLGVNGLARVNWEAMPAVPGSPITVRYAYWVEDMQSRVDAETAGNEEGTSQAHRRSGPTDVGAAPGLGRVPNTPAPVEKALRDLALYALDPDSTALDGGTLDNHVIKNRFAPTLGTLVALRGGTGQRNPTTGKPLDPRDAALEESVVVGLQPYDEAALIPYATDTTGKRLFAKAGQPMMDLNDPNLVSDPARFIDNFANTIRDNLPDFERLRKGGFPENYLETLGASARDYADLDSGPNIAAGRYRGQEAYPSVSEMYYRFRWENIERRDGRVYAFFTITPYVELWNPTNVDIQGSFQLSLEANYVLNIGFNQYSFTGGAIPGAGDAAICTPLPARRDGDFWCPVVDISSSANILPRSGTRPSGALRPNEYRMYELQQFTFRFDGGPASVVIPSPLAMNEDNTSGYRFMFNGQEVDRSAGPVRRLNMSLYYPNDAATNSRQQYRGTLPGHSYRPAGFVNNMGDSRMAYYIPAPQDPSAYPDNASPGRRNVRWEIFRSNANRIFGRVKPSEWPDGGHDALMGTPVSVPSDRRINMDDTRFYAGAPPVEPEKAPQRLSNRGYFVSATELGHIYDPVMWDQGMDSDVTSTSLLHDIATSARASANHGGGNTLRIGRVEHRQFDVAGARASHLMDLFQAGQTLQGVKAGFRRIEGHVNLNTATRDTLRALAAGPLLQDPLTNDVSREDSASGDKQTQARVFSAPTTTREADLFADAVIAHREANGPFQSLGEFARLRRSDGTSFFGNLANYNTRRAQLTSGTWTMGSEWSDPAAEELYARVANGSTVRSRNFRVHVTAEVVSTNGGRVLARRSRFFQVFMQPGERSTAASPMPAGFPRAVLVHSSEP